jgi:hypothetical protein
MGKLVRTDRDNCETYKHDQPVLKYYISNIIINGNWMDIFIAQA